jgi:hypothetical protein
VNVYNCCINIAQECNGYTPLIMATNGVECQISCVRQLLNRRDVDINKMELEGHTVRMILEEQMSDEEQTEDVNVMIYALCGHGRV